MNPPNWLPQYQALVSGVGIADLTGRSQVELRGTDAVRFLHSFCTNDVQRLAPGEGCEAFVTNHQGKTIGHVFIFRHEDSLLVDAVAGQSAALIGHFDRFVISDDVTFQDRTEGTGLLLVAGPKCRELLEQVTGQSVSTERWRHSAAEIAGTAVQVRCVDFLRPASYIVAAPREAAAGVAAAIEQAGAVHCGPEAVAAVRIESGTPLFGSDMTPDNLPQEIGRNVQAISFTKGCYLGQETVARIDALGHVNRLLAGVRFLETRAELPAAGAELSSGGKVVGQVTSACWSPRLDCPLALALVRRSHTGPGTKLDSPLGPAEVVALPLAGPSQRSPS